MPFQGVFFDEEGLKDIVESLGITICGETATDLQLLCPFHDNTDTPAMTMSKQGPMYPWRCWNGACAQTGNIISLFTKRGYTYDEVVLKLNAKYLVGDDFAKFIMKQFKQSEDPPNRWAEFDWEILREADKVSDYPALKYFTGRGLSEEAYNYFQIGYSIPQDMMVIPVRNKFGVLMGLIGRSITGKTYKYSSHLPRNLLIWNVFDCIWHQDESYIALTEGALDAMYLWDAGVKSVGAVLGSALSQQQVDLVRAHFMEVVCWFDNDDAGRGITQHASNKFNDMLVTKVEYPREDIKDPGELTAEEIQKMFRDRPIIWSTALEIAKW